MNLDERGSFAIESFSNILRRLIRWWRNYNENHNESYHDNFNEKLRRRWNYNEGFDDRNVLVLTPSSKARSTRNTGQYTYKHRGVRVGHANLIFQAHGHAEDPHVL